MTRMKSSMRSNMFELDMSDDQDEENFGDDNHSNDSFDDMIDPTPVANKQDGIVFAQDDHDLFPSDPEDDAGSPEGDDFHLQGYKDYRSARAPTELQGFDEPTVADNIYDLNSEDEDIDEITRYNTERNRLLTRTPPKPSKPAHFLGSTHAAERAAKRATTDGSRSYDIDEEAVVAYKATSRKAGSFGRHNREKGSTLPAYHKKVTHELDSDDELILGMRDKGYSDKQISERLKKENRVRYDAKSISTRVQRIKVIQSERSDFELENGMKEWTMEDDQLLMRAYDLAGIEVAYEIERLRAWRWKKTAEWMHRMNKGSTFSGKSCHKRYSALMDGTATIPCDVDDNPKQRKADMEKFRQDREDQREKEREDKENKEAERQRIKEEAAIRSSQKAVKTAEKNRARIVGEEARATERATKKALRSQQAEDNLRKKQELAAAKKKMKDDKEAERKFRDDFSLKNFKHVTKDTPDPRRVLDIPDLQKLCRERKINDHTPRMKGLAAKKVLLKRLKIMDEAMKHNDLVTQCRNLGIPTGGTKIQMAYQLALCAARDCDSYIEDEIDAGGVDMAEGAMEVDRPEATQ